MFKESFTDRNNKIDFKRVTTFVFVIYFLFAATYVLVVRYEIPNKALMDTVFYIAGAVILGACGFSMINKPTMPIKNDTTNEEFQPRGDA